MKLEYTKPELEIEVFETEDVITISVLNSLDDPNGTYEQLFGSN